MNVWKCKWQISTPNYFKRVLKHLSKRNDKKYKIKQCTYQEVQWFEKWLLISIDITYNRRTYIISYSRQLLLLHSAKTVTLVSILCVQRWNIYRIIYLFNPERAVSVHCWVSLYIYALVITFKYHKTC